MATETEPFVFVEGMHVTAITSNGEELTGGVIVGYAVKFPNRVRLMTFGSDELVWTAPDGEVLPDPPECCSWYPDNFWGSWRDVPEQCPKCGRHLPR